ncbi:hypothetical protein DL770_010036 [Monosporascus sp. CRB-9-2]|nr:hypothetical protein DL770_010036 [Monosporascus sp. CRB-9-2]
MKPFLLIGNVLIGQGAAIAVPFETVDGVAGGSVPAPPKAEPIDIVELPLPPILPNNAAPGACDSVVNPRKTGCLAQSATFQSGGFTSDGNHVLATVTFVGAPPPPDPASVYDGLHIILVKTDSSTFPNGDKWKCLTCGVPAQNSVGISAARDYPQAFPDGKRALAGDNVIDCGNCDLTNPKCTANRTFIYPIRWNISPDGSGAGGSIRELRLHPDNVHLGFNSFTTTNGKLGQFGYFARLTFNPSPTTGVPLSPRYDLTNVTRLYNPGMLQPITTSGTQLYINPSAISVGELRGFTGRGLEVTYVGYPAESSNIDLFAVGLLDGKVRRLTTHPEYADPIDFSPDDKWFAVMDTRGSNRQMFISGMRNIPPVTDLISVSVTSSTRNNGQRRFFQPYMLDYYGDRGSYHGQKINGPGYGAPGSGSINDPEWNGRADPKWAPDSSKLVYWESQTTYPDCGGTNPLPCYPSKEPGGRTYRLMLAKFTSRKPNPAPRVAPAPDAVPWGVPYVPGSVDPERPEPAPGNYTLTGKVTGYAKVKIIDQPNTGYIGSVAVTYYNYSDDGKVFLDGWENVTSYALNATLNHIDWFSDIRQSGATQGRKKTSEDGFHLEIDVLTNKFNANGTLTTVIDGVVYTQPLNGA